MLERVCLVGMQTGTATMENSVEIPLKKLVIELPYDQEIPLLGMHPKKPALEDTPAPQFSLQHYLQ